MTRENEIFTTLDSLSDELNTWYDANGLEHLSADDALCSDSLTDPQRDYLYEFIDRWENAVRQQERTKENDAPITVVYHNGR